MDQRDWVRKLDELKQGKLHLTPAGESGMTAYANTAVYELREYVKALEQGYRRRGETIYAYRHMEQARDLARRFGKARGDQAGEHAAGDAAGYEAACLGYTIMAMRQAGFRDREIECVLDAAREIMQVASVEDAAGGYEVRCTGREDGQCGEQGRPAGDGDGGLSQPALRRTEAAASGGPEWIGPSAEMKSEVQG